MPRPRPILEDWDRPLEEEEGVGDWEVEVNAVDEVGLEGEEEVVDWGGELVEAAGVAVEPVATLLADAVALLTILLAATVSEAIAGMV